MLPLEVLKTAAAEMTDYRGSGMSVMEMSHRSSWFDNIITEAEADLRTLMNISDEYSVLFMQGGASTAFAAIPLNFMKTGHADYVVSGNFSKKAFEEAQKYGDAKCIASSKDVNFASIPVVGRDDIRPEADYLHICFNNTIFGTTYNYIPDTGDIPLIADMSSCILSEPVDVSRFGVIYAGAQKNMAPAGLTVAIVRRDLLGNAKDITPTMLNYTVLSDNKSLYNTPPCYTIYMAGLVYKYLLSIGGLSEMKKINEHKAGILYGFLDSSKLFKPTAAKEFRSLMNVTFVTGDQDLDKKFCAEATDAGFLNIKGHRLVGGMRASIYNAMPTEGVEALVEFMKKFEKENG